MFDFSKYKNYIFLWTVASIYFLAPRAATPTVPLDASVEYQCIVGVFVTYYYVAASDRQRQLTNFN
jgi:hypothetical protein